MARAKKAVTTRNKTDVRQYYGTKKMENKEIGNTEASSPLKSTSTQAKTKRFFIDIATKLDKIELAINSSKSSLRLDGQSLLNQERKPGIDHQGSVTSSL